jgi:hypothetical protein
MGGCRTLHSLEMHNVELPSIIRPRTTGWAGYIVLMGEIRNTKSAIKKVLQETWT